MHLPKFLSKFFIFLSLLCFVFIFHSCQKISAGSNYVTVLKDGWHILSSEQVKGTGDQISSPDFEMEDWYPATIPTTVLAALVENKVYQDIYFGKNLESIPTEQFKQSWWYRKEFQLTNFAMARLIFEGINYSADIWLNGQKIASSDTLLGSFRMFDIDITKLVNAKGNVLAIEVFPPKPGDFTIGFVDWNPRPPDANMGIWREVKLRTSGAVSVNNPFVQSKVNLETLDQADLTITADLVNHSDQELAVLLKGQIADIQLEQSYSLKPHEKKQVTLNSEQYNQLSIKNPRLWWPNNLGEPNLYALDLKVFVDNQISDARSIQFGIREVSDYINESGHRGYKINGKKVLIRGGGWVDDLLLANDDKKIEDQVRYAKHMNLNTIRLEGFWGSSQTLYNLADQYGMLLMAGWSCQWEWRGYLGKPTDKFGGIKTPEDMELITCSLRDQVLWLRNHPSVYVWVFGSDMLPRPELEKKYISCLETIDQTRPTLGACGLSVSEISGPTAVKMNGPYDYVTPNYWYVNKTNGGAFGFNTETGPGPQPPPLESIKKMIPPDHLWPIDDVWEYHCGRNQFNKLTRYNNALEQRYGAPETVEEYSQKAQIANYEAIRAMFEAFDVNKYNSTGVIQWMLNSAWPEMYWKLYDYYLMPNGAFYGTKTACKPVNIVYNYGDKDIYVVNDTFSLLQNQKVDIRIFDINSQVIFEKQVPFSIEENTSQKILELPEIENLSSVYFLDLKLFDADDKKKGENFYWLSTKDDVLDDERTLWFVTPIKEYADFTALKNLPEITLDVDYVFNDLEQDQEVVVSLKNPSESIAFFIELNVYGAESGLSILPIFWDDNYISLLPGDEKEIHGQFAKDDLKSEKPAFKLSGWNVKND